MSQETIQEFNKILEEEFQISLSMADSEHITKNIVDYFNVLLDIENNINSQS